MSTHSYRRLAIAVLFSILAAIGLSAASPHYKPGLKPTCTIDPSNGVATCSSGTVAGLGNDDVLVVVTVSGEAGTFCHNPGNSLVVPGQNPAEGSGSGGVLIDADDIKNGTLVIPQIVTGAVTISIPTPREAGCPNGQWTVTLSEVVYSGFYSFQQPPGQQINKLSFSF